MTTGLLQASCIAEDVLVVSSERYGSPLVKIRADKQAFSALPDNADYGKPGVKRTQGLLTVYRNTAERSSGVLTKNATALQNSMMQHWCTNGRN